MKISLFFLLVLIVAIGLFISMFTSSPPSYTNSNPRFEVKQKLEDIALQAWSVESKCEAGDGCLLSIYDEIDGTVMCIDCEGNIHWPQGLDRGLAAMESLWP